MTPWLQDPDVTLYHGDCLDVLRQLPDRSVHMCATSPPFYGLRDYGTGEWDGGDAGCDHVPDTRQGSDKQDAERRERGERRGYAPGSNFANYGSGQTAGDAVYRSTCGKCGARRVDQQIGLEETPDQWVERLVAVFREVRRVLRDDGTLWVEIGDSYHGGGYSNHDINGPEWKDAMNGDKRRSRQQDLKRANPSLKPKDLVGQPWLLAFALRADGWWLRSEIIWARPNPMPESVTDRPTKSHSTVFLLSKQPRYFYDADAIREDIKETSGLRQAPSKHESNLRGGVNGYVQRDVPTFDHVAGANARSVWTIPTQPTPYAHFATWPEALVRRMILAGTSERGCCPECGAPWVRETRRESVPHQKTYNGAIGGVGVVPGDVRHRNNDVPQTPSVTTVGWLPSCACALVTTAPHAMNAYGLPGANPHPPVPCTVLDPFAGSATTNLVARNHGRHSIGIELNEDYLRIAAKRLQQLSLLSESITE